MRPFWKRSPTEEKQDASDRNVISMLTTVGESYYAWNGKMYESDIIRACIRPKVKAGLTSVLCAARALKSFSVQLS